MCFFHQSKVILYIRKKSNKRLYLNTSFPFLPKLYICDTCVYILRQISWVTCSIFSERITGPYLLHCCQDFLARVADPDIDLPDPTLKKKNNSWSNPKKDRPDFNLTLAFLSINIDKNFDFRKVLDLLHCCQAFLARVADPDADLPDPTL